MFIPPGAIYSPGAHLSLCDEHRYLWLYGTMAIPSGILHLSGAHISLCDKHIYGFNVMVIQSGTMRSPGAYISLCTQHISRDVRDSGAQLYVPVGVTLALNWG
jgi:hypothetical protein